VSLDGVTALSGLVVGVFVGATGVGGGALMTPILMLLFGVAPQTAVGTDLLFASITKVCGTGVHQRQGTVDWQVVRRLSMGSLPAAALTLLWMHANDSAQTNGALIASVVGVAMATTALGMLFKDRLHAIGRRLRIGDPRHFTAVQPIATVVAGAILGVLVSLTSIGAGAVGSVMLVCLYPLRLTPARLVGTDMAHAIPLALLAGLGHLLLGHVDYALLVNLLVGSIPGVLLGSLISTKAPMRLVQVSIATVLGAVATKMLCGA
jgi:uncharacterized membrane protein YfcA